MTPVYPFPAQVFLQTVALFLLLTGCSTREASAETEHIGTPLFIASQKELHDAYLDYLATIDQNSRSPSLLGIICTLDQDMINMKNNDWDILFFTNYIPDKALARKTLPTYLLIDQAPGLKAFLNTAGSLQASGRQDSLTNNEPWSERLGCLAIDFVWAYNKGLELSLLSTNPNQTPLLNLKALPYNEVWVSSLPQGDDWVLPVWPANFEIPWSNAVICLSCFVALYYLHHYGLIYQVGNFSLNFIYGLYHFFFDPDYFYNKEMAQLLDMRGLGEPGKEPITLPTHPSPSIDSLRRQLEEYDLYHSPGATN